MTRMKLDPGSQSASRRMAEGLHEIVGGAAELMATGRDRSVEGVRGVVARTQSRLRMVGARAADRAHAAGHSTGRYVAERPWRALAIVGAVGVALGWLLHRNDADR